MPETCCCVPGCSNRGGHKFPSDQTRRKSWIHAIRRGETRFQSLEPSLHVVVCRLHFTESDYFSETVHGKYLWISFQNLLNSQYTYIYTLFNFNVSEIISWILLKYIRPTDHKKMCINVSKTLRTRAWICLYRALNQMIF